MESGGQSIVLHLIPLWLDPISKSAASVEVWQTGLTVPSYYVSLLILAAFAFLLSEIDLKAMGR
jgi:type III secretory pathway component EscT